MSHHPTASADAAGTDADPLRPYHVHELLTRHQQGKRRGQNGSGDGGAPAGENGAGPTGPVWEDGRR